MTATAQAPRLARERIRRTVGIFEQRHAAAVRWRTDHLTDPLRDQAWRAYRNGASWTVRHPGQDDERRATSQALAAAEARVPFQALTP